MNGCKKAYLMRIKNRSLLSEPLGPRMWQQTHHTSRYLSLTTE